MLIQLCADAWPVLDSRLGTQSAAIMVMMVANDMMHACKNSWPFTGEVWHIIYDIFEYNGRSAALNTLITSTGAICGNNMDK